MIEAVKESLTDLRLKGIAENLEIRNQEALSSGMSYLDFLKCLLEDEKARRDRKAYHIRLKTSGLKPSKSLDNYKFTFQPCIDPKQIAALANCDFIANKGKIIFIGVSGVGKTHLINGIGLKAVEKGYSVIRFNANRLAEKLIACRKDGSYEEFTRKIFKADFIIIDEFALRPLCEGGTEEIFALLEDLDENTALAITSNRDFKDWKHFFSDNTFASAFTDRAVNQATIIKVEAGTSYRMKNFHRQDEDFKSVNSSK